MSLAGNTFMRQDMQDYAALVFDFGPILSATSGQLPSDAQITFTKMAVAPECLDELPYRFPGYLTEEELRPVVVITNKTAYVDQVQDSDEEPKYTAAAVVWSIFFVLLLISVPAVFYVVRNVRKTLGVENQDLKKLEDRIKAKRGKLEEN